MDTSTGKIILVDDEAAKDLQKLKELKVAAGKEKGKLVKLNKEPKKDCKRCYGRGHIGMNVKTGEYVPCNCTEPEI